MQIKKHVVKGIIAHALEDSPLEACGYLAGKEEVVSHHVPLTNMDKSPEHYSLDPKEQFDTVRDLRNRGLKVIAVYHSHPCSPARMSEEDIRLAHDPDMRYVIISLYNGTIVKSFRVRDSSVEEEELVIIGSEISDQPKNGQQGV